MTLVDTILKIIKENTGNEGCVRKWIRNILTESAIIKKVKEQLAEGDVPKFLDTYYFKLSFSVWEEEVWLLGLVLRLQNKCQDKDEMRILSGVVGEEIVNVIGQYGLEAARESMRPIKDEGYHGSVIFSIPHEIKRKCIAI